MPASALGQRAVTFLAARRPSREAPVGASFVQIPVTAMKRRANWTPVVVSNALPQKKGGKTSAAGDAFAVSAREASHVTHVADPLPGNTTETFDQQKQRRADLRFSMGVALAFALPVIIALTVYLTAGSILLKAASRMPFIG
jgi:hypothetical protein